MAEIVVFHSVLGVRDGVLRLAEEMRAAGHAVRVPDLYGGRVFDDYAEALGWLDEMGGLPELIRRTHASVEGVGADVVYAGFSNGAGSAQLLAATRPGALGAVLLHGAMPMAAFGPFAEGAVWPVSVPVQVHYATHDPFRSDEGLNAFAAETRAAGAEFELFEYPVSGHLITDPGLTEEYDGEAAELITRRVLEFLDRVEADVEVGASEGDAEEEGAQGVFGASGSPVR